ncbi:DDE transposase [Aliidongia dinghuensis]|uniref:DDE transposase n=1 Tax=Aliidongia dinghuensis TaxID=1867774 RepID=A0A8J3E0F3_9PROT|nr:IS1595 family transposase [Aliidongia dinghuensis]GGF01324.1 DDE transposase [Aliidongia dinghuensis]
MAQHYLLSRKCRTLPLHRVFRMSEEAAYKWFLRARWPETDGVPYCPRCGVTDAWETRRRRFKCRAKDCRCEFSVTSGTIFAHHKLPFRQLLAAIALSAHAVKGKAALQVARELGVQYKTAWANLMKLREAIAAERASLMLEGTVEVDGMYVGGHIRPENRAEDRIDRRLRENQTGKRKCVIAIRQRNGRIVTAITKTEDAAVIMPLLQRYARHAHVVVADEHHAYNQVAAVFEEVERVNHSLAYRSEAGVSTNQVESFFSRVRRGEWGTFHHIASQYLDWYAFEMAWREDHRRTDMRTLVRGMLSKAMGHRTSRWLCGYWQGNHPPKDAFMVVVP